MDRLQLFFCELIQKQQSGAPLTPLFTGAHGLRKWAQLRPGQQNPTLMWANVGQTQPVFLKHLY
jgi:hypothetical protein